MLFNQPNANNVGSAIFYVGPTLALRCKANTKKVVAFQIHLAHVDVGPTLVLRLYPTPTISQWYNGLPALAQRSHAIWDLREK